MKTKNDREHPDVAGSGKDSGDRKTEEEEYTYQTSGIRERKGFIPLWLLLLATTLICWGVVYLAQNWSPPLGN